MDKQILKAISNLEKRVVDLYHKLKSFSVIPGPQGEPGLQGVQGIPGTPGAVGPAGLEWQGAWVSGTSYIADDAVGYNGASWFCILATSGTVAPNLDTTHWALLSSQGALGLQGVQGPIGPQGVAPTKTTANITATALFPVLTADINYVNTNGSNRGVLLPTTTVLGKEIIIYTNALALDRTVFVKVDLINSIKISYQGISSNVSQLELKSNENWKFTALNGGYWKAEAIGATLQQVVSVGSTITNGDTTVYLNEDSITIEDLTNSYISLQPNSLNLRKNNQFNTIVEAGTVVTAPRTITLPDASGILALVSVDTTENLASTTGSAPFPYSNSDFVKFTSALAYALPVATLGDVKYVLTTSSATLWASPNPGVDGANNNFIDSNGNGNSYISLLPNKSYRFTYIGRHGSTYGYWTAEIMNP